MGATITDLNGKVSASLHSRRKPVRSGVKHLWPWELGNEIELQAKCRLPRRLGTSPLCSRLCRRCRARLIAVQPCCSSPDRRSASLHFTGGNPNQRSAAGGRHQHSTGTASSTGGGHQRSTGAVSSTDGRDE